MGSPGRFGFVCLVLVFCINVMQSYTPPPKGIIHCFHQIGITDACIKSFTKMNSSEDKYKHFLAKPSNDCKEWQAQDKYGQKAKACLADAKRTRNTFGRKNCPKWILTKCKKCCAPIFIIFAFCMFANGCDV